MLARSVKSSIIVRKFCGFHHNQVNMTMAEIAANDIWT